MAGLSNYLELKLLEWVTKKTQLPTPPTGLWVSLHSADPGDTGASELAASGSYARASLAPDTNNATNTNWNAVDQGSAASKASNASAITFPTATGNWNSSNPIIYFAVWDAVTTGNCLWSGTIASGTGVVVLSGTQLTFAAGSPGQLALTID